MFKDWIRCIYCGRWMHKKAKTCGNYCKWDELVGSKKEEEINAWELAHEISSLGHSFF